MRKIAYEITVLLVRPNNSMVLFSIRTIVNLPATRTDSNNFLVKDSNG